jgi:hypothetical protein
LEDLVASLQDPEDDYTAGCEHHALSLCLFSSGNGKNSNSKPRNSLSLAYRKLEKLASSRESLTIPVFVQTQAQRGELPPAKSSAKQKISPNLGRKEKVDAVTTNQRQSPLSSWIGKQLLGQKVPKR